MTCYMRHMGWLFDALDMPNEKPVRKQVDGAIRQVLSMPPETHCPEVWAALKALPDEERAALPGEVSAILKG